MRRVPTAGTAQCHFGVAKTTSSSVSSSSLRSGFRNRFILDPFRLSFVIHSANPYKVKQPIGCRICLYNTAMNDI
jgi:hypothetical protein